MLWFSEYNSVLSNSGEALVVEIDPVLVLDVLLLLRYSTACIVACIVTAALCGKTSSTGIIRSRFTCI